MSLTGPASTMTLSNPATNPKKKAQVRVERLDSLIRDNVYLLKIDTQGFDQFVLEGALQLFENHVVRQVIVEVDPRNLMYNGHKPSTILNLLQSYGMACFQTRTDQKKTVIFGERISMILKRYSTEQTDGIGPIVGRISFVSMLRKHILEKRFHQNEEISLTHLKI